MRKLPLLGLILALSVLALPVSASADKPIKEPTPTSPFVFTGDTAVCAFPVSTTSPVNGGFGNTHLDKNGNVRWFWGGGHNTEQFTNVNNNKSVELNTTGPGKITFNPDGSLTIDGTGHWSVAYFATDSPSMALIYYSGHIVLNVSPTGTLTLVSYVGAAPQDVCAMIA